jgi:hypothetical protein
MTRKASCPVSMRRIAALLLLPVLTACDPAEALLGPPAYAKGGKNAGGSTGASVVQGDLVLRDTDAPALVSTCPSAGFSGNDWVVSFGKSGCFIVEINDPFWTGSLPPYTLADDILINVQQEKGRNGRITHVRIAGQDVDGPDGIWHNTDWIALAEPVTPDTKGFTLHVHASNIAVWRTDSHLAGGNRVEVIGFVSLGDIVYPAQ